LELKRNSRKTRKHFLRLFKSEFLNLPINVIKNSFKKNVTTLSEHVFASSVFSKSTLGKVDWKNELQDRKIIYNRNLLNDSKEMRLEFLKQSNTYLGMKWYLQSHQYGTESVDPTSDARIVELSLSFPEYVFNDLGNSKFLVKSMMHQFIPEKILYNQYKMSQSGDVGLRLNNHSDWLDLINEIQEKCISKPEYLRIDDLKQMLSEIQQCSGLMQKRKLVHIFLHKLSIAIFYSKNYSKLCEIN
jgi:hypothetical protein